MQFVYGSLMTDETALKSGKAAFVRDHAVRFTHVGLPPVEPSFANIEWSPGDVAWGVIVDFDDGTWKEIQKRELSYSVIKVMAETPGGEACECETFTLKGILRGRERPPSARYAKMLLDGARRHNFPQDVVERYEKYYRNGNRATLKMGPLIRPVYSIIRLIGGVIKR